MLPESPELPGEAPSARPPLIAGTLYLVATPIGNLEDITLRALRVLRECDAVCAEDTRHTGQLLTHFGIRKPLLSYHKFNEARRSEEILERLRGGQRLALVTDAGSPGISDPGERVVAACVAAGLRVEPIPGACALIAGLTASGLPTEAFRFAGFPPVKSGQRTRRLKEWLAVSDTVVLYESPYRVEKLLTEIAALAPERPVAVARELTKKFEEWLRGTARTVAADLQRRPRKGEFVVMIGPAPKSADREPASAVAEVAGDEDDQELDSSAEPVLPTESPSL
jgi:16S rRNA (cytidine1402-2'-O)-methyltransferase